MRELRSGKMMLFLLAGAVFAGSLATAARGEKGALNVLFIAVDDLRPQLGCYGDPVVKSPNIDRLARGGILFERAYCSQAHCAPSRAAMLTGRRPDTTGIHDLQGDFRQRLPDVVTLPQHFKNHGYHSQGLSKIYHQGRDDPASWSVPLWEPDWPGYGRQGRAFVERRRRETGEERPRGPCYEIAADPDSELADGATADRAIAVLKEVKDRPFFLAVGFLRPHLPWAAPKRYWDLYDRARLPLAPNPFPPKDAPRYALGGQERAEDEWGGQNEPREYPDMPKEGPVTDEEARTLIHGYLASISYMDAQVGRVLAELDRLGLRERTVVVLWGDHGWQNGEHGMWCKHSNYETSVRLPLIVAAPGLPAGRKSNALVESVDLYPTLAELGGLPTPAGVEGQSFVPLLRDPGRVWKQAIFHQYPKTIPGVGRGMGYAIRTDRYRLVEWTVPGTAFREVELYDLKSDPQENVNVAKRPEHAGRVRELTRQLHAGWRAARAD